MSKWNISFAHVNTKKTKNLLNDSKYCCTTQVVLYTVPLSKRHQAVM